MTLGKISCTLYKCVVEGNDLSALLPTCKPIFMPLAGARVMLAFAYILNVICFSQSI